MDPNYQLTHDEVTVDKFKYPSNMQETAEETAPSAAPFAIRVVQKADEHHVTVSAFRDDGTAQMQRPITVTISSGDATFGRMQKPFLSFAMYGIAPADMARLLSMAADAVRKFETTEARLNKQIAT